MNSETAITPAVKPAPLPLSNLECEAMVVIVLIHAAQGNNGLTVGEVTKAVRAAVNGDFSAYQMRRALYACAERGWIEKGVMKNGKRNFQLFTTSPITAAACGAMYYCAPPLKKQFRKHYQELMHDALSGARNGLWGGVVRCNQIEIDNVAEGQHDPLNFD